MEKVDTNIEFTKELYLKISADKSSQITSLREQNDDAVEKINGYIEYLKELSIALKQVKDKIKVTQNALRESRKRKWAIKRELSMQNRFAKSLNKAFSRGEETIDLKKFYTAAEQKIR